MELRKADIQNVANGRWFGKHRRKWVGAFLGALVLAIGIMLAFGEREATGLTIHGGLVTAAAIAPVIAWAVWMIRSQTKEARLLVEECEANPTLSYRKEA